MPTAPVTRARQAHVYFLSIASLLTNRELPRSRPAAPQRHQNASKS